MTPLDYAKLCAARYSLARYKIKGNGHDPRVIVDTSKAFMKLLPHEKICTTKRGGMRRFTAARIEEQYFLDLLHAGLDPNASSLSPRRGEGRGEGWACILSMKHWQAALAYHRLTGHLPETDTQIALKVQANYKRRQQRHRKEMIATLEAERESRKLTAEELDAREKAADATLSASFLIS